MLPGKSFNFKNGSMDDFACLSLIVVFFSEFSTGFSCLLDFLASLSRIGVFTAVLSFSLIENGG